MDLLKHPDKDLRNDVKKVLCFLVEASYYA